MIPVKPVIEADLLIVGGGIGGLMAGIAAGKAGCKNVVIMEKCHARRSGSGATGNDHFNCYIPSYHGDDIEPVFKETMQSLVGQLKEPSLMHKFLEKSFELVQMWDAWGVNMRPTGDWECKGHALPGKPRAFLKYDGSDQKKVLVREAKAVGVKFYNHHPVVELARVGDRIAGALAVDISTGTARLCPGPGQNRPARHRTHAPPVHERVHAGLHVQYGALPQLRGRTGPRLARGRAHGQHGIPLHPCRAQVFAALRQGDVDRRLPLSRRQAHRPLRHQVRSAVRGRDQRHLEFRL